MWFLGIDIGSSSVKLSLFDGEAGKRIASVIYPEEEMEIVSPQSGWAEQDPELWWDCVKKGCRKLFTHNYDPASVSGIGISYQMHGLVLVDKQQRVLRPAIIWCDSRAIQTGEQAFQTTGVEWCQQHLLNSPGNFTASKLKWVKEHEPVLYQQIHKMMLPGDFIAMKLSGEITTTASGLSEGVLWDFRGKQLANRLLEKMELDERLIPERVPTLGWQGKVTAEAAESLGIKPGVPIVYRAGDQPNNAFSLNVLQPGELAATAGTSGVIYAVTEKPVADPESRVNTFLHVSDTPEAARNGVLLCVNGTGILYSWLKKNLQGEGQLSYERLNALAAEVPAGAGGLSCFPFGNGAERMLNNRIVTARWEGLNFNLHQRGHLARAAQEGIVFALNYGFEVLKELGVHSQTVRAGQANMFLSPVFRNAFVNTTGTVLELYETDGAEGAARAAALGAGYFKSYTEAFQSLTCLSRYEPGVEAAMYQELYQSWKERLKEILTQ
ncbi:FGGY family carbohydrate kinase [Rapidithrix thailandica]|uniref:FGGY family carbohydrate kinase n=1 Tax=Rapidithrix thailandica TaxID=413964 RepID=A0AAW9SBE8_9BACT